MASLPNDTTELDVASFYRPGGDRALLVALDFGDGDPALALFGQAVTPNQHNLALNFVTLDRFLAARAA